MANLASLRKKAVKTARRRTKYVRLRARYQAHSHVLGNRDSRQAFKRRPPDLGATQSRLVEDLKRDGVATAKFSELFDDQALWDALSTEMHAFAEEARASTASGPDAPRKKDEYLIRRCRRLAAQLKKQGVKPALPPLAPDSAWLRFGTAPEILDTVNAYRGMQTKLIDLDQWYTVPFGADHTRVASQNWHRDPEDLHVVKVFVYYNDVDEDAGPFQYILGSPKGSRYGHLWPWSVTGKHYPSPEELESKVPTEEQFTAVGERGTVIFCDTSGFHRGGYARTNPRLLSYHTFVSPATVLSRRESRSFKVDPAPAPDALSPQAQFALT
jgi:hypothetical protein